MNVPRTIEWVGGLDGYIRMIDQTLLPAELKMIECRDAAAMWEAISVLRVRGAPAIGIAGAMGLVLGIREAKDGEREAFFRMLRQQRDYLAGARPTAVNLKWALDRMVAAAESCSTKTVAEIKVALLNEAVQIRDEDAASCRAIGRLGADLIPDGGAVLTHCNAGSLAAAEYGTALAGMYVAHEQGKRFRVYSCETRPLLQGARLTAWELSQAGIDVTTICDGMVGALMGEGKINCVITGADRIAANGDTANKIGTYGIAVLADAHGIPFHIAAPVSTFDFSCASGSEIPIEHRSADEVRVVHGRPISPPDVPAYNPAFDVTPARLIHSIVTDRGIVEPVSSEAIARLLRGASPAALG